MYELGKAPEWGLYRHFMLAYRMDPILTFSSTHSTWLVGWSREAGPEQKQNAGFRPKGWMAQAERKGLSHRTGRWLSGDLPALLGISRSHGTCPQLLKEPDLWQRPMISAVSNDTVKLINPSLCPQEEKSFWCQYCSLLVLDQALQTQTFSEGMGHHWRMALKGLPLHPTPIKPPPLVNKPSHGNISFDNTTSVNSQFSET